MDQVSKKVAERVRQEFPEDTVPEVLKSLLSYNSESPEGEERIQLACIDLAKGDPEALFDAVNAAKVDFRDVLYWQELRGGKVKPLPSSKIEFDKPKTLEFLRLRRIKGKFPFYRKYEIEIKLITEIKSKKYITRTPSLEIEPYIGMQESWSLIDAADNNWKKGIKTWVTYYDMKPDTKILNEAIHIYVEHGILPERHPEKVLEKYGSIKGQNIIDYINQFSDELYNLVVKISAEQHDEDLVSALEKGKKELSIRHPEVSDSTLDELVYSVSYDLR